MDNQVKALTKEKKEKENVLKYLELINLQNVFMLGTKELRRKTTKVKKEQLMEDNEYKSGITQEEAIQPEIPHDVKGGIMIKKTKRNSRIGKGGGYSNTKIRNIQDTTSKNRTTN